MKKKKNKLYFGMTVTQIGILAGAALVGLIIMLVAIIFIFTATAAAPQAQPQPATATTIALPSETPVLNTPAIEDTPTPAPAAVISTDVPPDGWVEFTTQGAGLWLPASFVGGDMTTDRQSTINKVTRLGKYYKNIVNNMKNADKDTVLWMVDKTVKITDLATTVTASHITIAEDIGLDQYINDFLNGDAGGTPVAMLLTINETKKMSILGRETKRLTYSSNYAGHGILGMIYYIKDGTTIWAINYSLIPDEYIDMLPIVEQSIHTFNLTPSVTS